MAAVAAAQVVLASRAQGGAPQQGAAGLFRVNYEIWPSPVPCDECGQPHIKLYYTGEDWAVCIDCAHASGDDRVYDLDYE